MVVYMQVYIVQKIRFLNDFFRSWIFFENKFTLEKLTPTYNKTVVSRQAMILDYPLSKRYRILFEKMLLILGVKARFKKICQVLVMGPKEELIYENHHSPRLRAPS